MINSLIEVFRMTEISKEARISVIRKIGNLINYEYASNVTEPLVYELVLLLDPDNEIKNDKHFLKKT